MSNTKKISTAYELNKAFARLLAAQWRALLIERQTVPDAGKDKLMLATVKSFRNFRKGASFLLSQTVPAAISDLLTPADRFTNMMKAVDKVLPSSAPDLDAASAARSVRYLTALLDSADDARAKAGHFGQKLQEWEQYVTATRDKLNRYRKQVIAGLDGEDGAIAELEEKITTKREEIDETIDDIVSASEALGGKLGELASSALTYLPTSTKPKPEDDKGGTDKPDTKDTKPPKDEPTDEPEGEDDTLLDDDLLLDDDDLLLDDDDLLLDDDDLLLDDDDLLLGDDDMPLKDDDLLLEDAATDPVKAKKKAPAKATLPMRATPGKAKNAAAKSGLTDEDKETSKKSIQTLKATTDSAKDIGGAYTALNKKNDELAELYLEMAELEVDLAWARAIGDQGSALNRSATLMTASTANILKTWDRTIDKLKSLTTDLEKNHDLQDLQKRWGQFYREERSPLAEQLPAIRSALAGRTTLRSL